PRTILHTLAARSAHDAVVRRWGRPVGKWADTPAALDGAPGRWRRRCVRIHAGDRDGPDARFFGRDNPRGWRSGISPRNGGGVFHLLLPGVGQTKGEAPAKPRQ